MGLYEHVQGPSRQYVGEFLNHQYFVEHHITKLSDKFLENARGYENLTRFVVLNCIRLIPELESITNSVSY